MLKSERINFLAKKVAPNPLEATYWIDLTEGPQGTVWKWFDPEDNIWKVLLLGNQKGSLDAYTKAESDRLFATNDSIEQLANELNTKQDTLVSEVNIRTINGISVLGSGDIHIDRGLNQEQVQDMIDESTKDFITVDETHEYVQEEIEKLKLVVLDKDKLSESISNLIFSNIVDFETLKEDLSITENHLLYVDPDNGMYREEKLVGNGFVCHSFYYTGDDFLFALAQCFGFIFFLFFLRCMRQVVQLCGYDV